MMSEQGLVRQEVIELKYIARALNEIIGADYRVLVNGRTTIASDNITDVCLRATRIPFALDGIGSETLDISLEVWANANNAAIRDKVLADLNALIGHRSGVIAASDKVYNYASFFEFSKPMGSPQVDTGNWRHLLTITGTMLVSDSETGAVISNAVLTKLYIGEPESSEAVQGFIPALSVKTGLSYASETLPSGNNNTADVVHNLQGCNISLTSLVLNRPLDNEILRIIQLCNAGFTLNSNICLKKIYPTFETTKKCRLLGGSIDEGAGAYLQYSLSLQEVP